MAAKLAWFGDRLKLGGCDGWTLGVVRREFGRWRAVLNRLSGQRAGYESMDEARQDLESEVRSLLKAAGVEVE